MNTMKICLIGADSRNLDSLYTGQAMRKSSPFGCEPMMEGERAVRAGQTTAPHRIGRLGGPATQNTRIR
jgi:hypothetical protein